MSDFRIIVGDCREVLKELPDESVQCIVTSPPYWGLRDYGTDGQLGLEATPDEYVATLVQVFREVRRVLREDGTLWLNLGDSYAAQGTSGLNVKGPTSTLVGTANLAHSTQRKNVPNGLKPKDLVGIPFRVAFALQADGWVLRSDIVWSKLNPMPESVRDRPTKAHEFLFLFSKAKWRGPESGRFGGISDADARWLALLVDAEGCIVVKRVSRPDRCDVFAPQVSIGSTSRELLERVVEIVGHGNVLEREGKNAPMFYWQLGHGLARDFLYRVYPFLIVKPRQARICIHVDSMTYYRGGRKPERKQRTDTEQAALIALWERNKSCNQFGEPDLSDVPEPVYGRWDSERYYYDGAAVAEAGSQNSHGGAPIQSGPKYQGLRADGGVLGLSAPRRNRRSVWTIATQPFPGSHFATFPEALVEPCVMAGTSEHGCCANCGAAWRRKMERTGRKICVPDLYGRPRVIAVSGDGETSQSMDVKGQPSGFFSNEMRQVGWGPSCSCDAAPRPCTVLDPFAGSGTVGVVCSKLGRDFIGIELNPEYAAMAERRIGAAPLSLFAAVTEDR